MNPLHGEEVTAGVMSIFYGEDRTSFTGTPSFRGTFKHSETLN